MCGHKLITPFWSTCISYHWQKWTNYKLTHKHTHTRMNKTTFATCTLFVLGFSSFYFQLSFKLKWLPLVNNQCITRYVMKLVQAICTLPQILFQTCQKIKLLDSSTVVLEIAHHGRLAESASQQWVVTVVVGLCQGINVEFVLVGWLLNWK